MTTFYVHGYETKTVEDKTPYVVLTTPIAIDSEQVNKFNAEAREEGINVALDITLYELRPIGPLAGGLVE